MKTKIFRIDDRVINFVSISEEDLKKLLETRIMEPWLQCHCDCCERHISELEPFGKAEDPPDDSLTNDFLDFLEKTFRNYGLSEDEIEVAMEPAKRYVGREFGDTLLMETSRRMAPYDEEAEAAIDEAMRCYERDGFNCAHDWMNKKYGMEKSSGLDYAAYLHNLSVVSWECKDCINLSEDEYFKKLEENYRKRKSLEENRSSYDRSKD